MVDYVPSEKGTPIRYPSTALLCLDSYDRKDPYIGTALVSASSPFNCQFIQKANILNGFFTRLSTTEIVLEWAEKNIDSSFNNQIMFDISGGASYTVTVPEGFYTVASLLDFIVCDLNDQSSSSNWTINQDCGNVSIKLTGGTFSVNYVEGDILVYQLGFQTSAFTTPASNQYIETPDIRLYRYLDFTCAQITYAQDVKDATTNPVNIDILARFYMSYDGDSIPDAYGFPILLGYKPTTIRRAFNPPKQIRWDSGLPIGNLVFQIYGGVNLGNNAEEIIPWYPDNPTPTNWMMTIQVSEV